MATMAFMVLLVKIFFTSNIFMSAGLLLQVKASNLEMFGAERKHTIVCTIMHYYCYGLQSQQE